jgi:hypothetical protein
VTRYHLRVVEASYDDPRRHHELEQALFDGWQIGGCFHSEARRATTFYLQRPFDDTPRQGTGSDGT